MLEGELYFSVSEEEKSFDFKGWTYLVASTQKVLAKGSLRKIKENLGPTIPSNQNVSFQDPRQTSSYTPRGVLSARALDSQRYLRLWGELSPYYYIRLSGPAPTFWFMPTSCNILTSAHIYSLRPLTVFSASVRHIYKG